MRRRTFRGRWAQLRATGSGWRFQLRDAQVVANDAATAIPGRRLFLGVAAAAGLSACSAGPFSAYADSASAPLQAWLPNRTGVTVDVHPMRAPGTAVFMNAEADLTPTALLHNLKHNHVLHETNLFATVHTLEVPWIPIAERANAQMLCESCWTVTLNFGFNDELDVPTALEQLQALGIALEPMTTSSFLSRSTILPTLGRGMAPWREKLYANMHRNAASAADSPTCRSIAWSSSPPRCRSERLRARSNTLLTC